MGILHSLKIGEVMSRSEIRAMICVREIDVDSSIQAQGTGEVMRRKWRSYGLFDRSFLICCATRKSKRSGGRVESDGVPAGSGGGAARRRGGRCSDGGDGISFTVA